MRYVQLNEKYHLVNVYIKDPDVFMGKLTTSMGHVQLLCSKVPDDTPKPRWISASSPFSDSEEKMVKPLVCQEVHDRLWPNTQENPRGPTARMELMHNIPSGNLR